MDHLIFSEYLSMADVVPVDREERLHELVEHFDGSELAPRKTFGFSEKKAEPIGNYLTLRTVYVNIVRGSPNQLAAHSKSHRRK